MTNGAPFWSGTKRFPKPLIFDPEDPMHVEFVAAAANLRAAVFGLSGSDNLAAIAAQAAAVKVPKFVPKTGVKIAANDKEAKEQAKEAAGVDPRELLAQLPPRSELAGLQLSPAE